MDALMPKSLMVRLFALILLVIVFPLAVLGPLLLDRAQVAVTDEWMVKARSEALGLALRLEMPLNRHAGLADVAPRLLESVKAGAGIAAIRVVAADGHVLATTTQADPSPHGLVASALAVMDVGVAVLVGAGAPLIATVPMPDESAATIQVVVAPAAVAAQLLPLWMTLVVLGLVAVVVAYHLVRPQLDAALEPLDRAGRMMSMVGDHDFTALAGMAGDDNAQALLARVDGLAAAVIGLYRRLSRRVDEIRRHHYDRSVVEAAGRALLGINLAFRFPGLAGPAVLTNRHPFAAYLPLFLVTFAFELARPFLVLAIGAAPNAPDLGGNGLVLALPLSLGLVAAGLCSRWASAAAQAVSARGVARLGAALAALGLGVLAASGDWWIMVAGLCLCGVGGGIVVAGCHSHMAGFAAERDLGRDCAVLAGLVFAARLAGAGAGGILVDVAGFRGLFLVGAGLAVAAFISSRDLPGDPTGPVPQTQRNGRFFALAILGAAPLRVLASGFVFFAIPLYLWRQGLGYGDIALAVMLYGLASLAVAPLAVPSTRGAKLTMVAVAGLAAAAAVLLPALYDGVLPVAAGMLLLGIAEGLAASSARAVIPDLYPAAGQGSALAGELLRIESVMAALGPLAAAVLVSGWGFVITMIAFAASTGVFAAAFVLAALLMGGRPEDRWYDDEKDN